MNIVITLLGIVCMLFSFAAALVGLTTQIWKNRREKKCGMSVYLILISLGLLFSRILYSLAIGAYYIVFPDALGLMFFTIILKQFWKYRPPQNAVNLE